MWSLMLRMRKNACMLPISAREGVSKAACPSRARPMERRGASESHFGPEAARDSRTVPACRRKTPRVAFPPLAGRSAAVPFTTAHTRGVRGGGKPQRMSRKLLCAALGAVALAGAVLAFTLPASAELRTFRVRLADGSIVRVTADAPCGALPSGLPGAVVGATPCGGGGGGGGGGG